MNVLLHLSFFYTSSFIRHLYGSCGIGNRSSLGSRRSRAPNVCNNIGRYRRGCNGNLGHCCCRHRLLSLSLEDKPPVHEGELLHRIAHFIGRPLLLRHFPRYIKGCRGIHHADFFQIFRRKQLAANHAHLFFQKGEWNQILPMRHPNRYEIYIYTETKASVPFRNVLRIIVFCDFPQFGSPLLPRF